MEHFKNAAACIGLVLLVSGQVTAADVPVQTYPSGTLNITGKILDKACTFNAKDFTIQLAPTQADAFTAVGDLGPKSTPVDFILTGCPIGSTVGFTVVGTQGADANSFKTDGGVDKATGVDLVLYNDAALIKPNFEAPLAVDDSGNYSSTLLAQLRTNAAKVTAGAVDTTLTYTLKYN